MILVNSTTNYKLKVLHLKSHLSGVGYWEVLIPVLAANKVFFLLL